MTRRRRCWRACAYLDRVHLGRCDPGARASAPLLIGLLPFGIVCGLASRQAGLSVTEAGVMSGVVFAGASQLVALAHWTHPAAVVPAMVAALTVNARLLLMGPVMTPWLRHLRGWRLLGSLFVMTDQNWALSVDAMERGEPDAAFLLGSGGVTWLKWVCTTMVGHAAGGLLHLTPGHPLFFAALAIFVCLLAQMWRGRRDAWPWLVAAAVGVAVGRIEDGGTWHIVAGALAGGFWGRVARPVTAANLLAFGAMAAATYGCRAGGYWLFRRLPPSAFVRSVMGYWPGALFAAFVVPALVEAGPKEWLAAAACLGVMVLTGRLVAAVVVGTAAAWAGWSARAAAEAGNGITLLTSSVRHPARVAAANRSALALIAAMLTR